MINIFYTVDDNFVPQLAANLCSICTNHPVSNNLKFYILSDGISDTNQELLTSFVKTFTQSIVFIDISEFDKNLGFDFDTTGWNKIVLARLLMERYLPSSLDRILYLDGDTLVLQDIELLWETDLQGKTIGMVCEPTVSSKRKKDLNLKSHQYHNAGVLLVDLNKWRETDAEQRLLAYCKESGSLFANDQDALNVVLSDEILDLPPKYNLSNVFDYYPYWYLNLRSKSFATQLEYLDGKSNPCIVHFLGEDRPWREGCTHRFCSAYDHYLSLTPWGNTSREKGWRIYFMFWKAFNVVMKPMPFVRLPIINSLIPFFLNFRKNKIAATRRN